MAVAEPAPRTLAARLEDALPQTQCTRCGYADCRAYAEAIAAGEAGINRCPPGGAEGVRRLAAISGQAARSLDPAHGSEGPLRLALIDEDWCIGCTLCIKACPVDCIVGAPRRMHTVIAAQCTGCELCVPACPVDCIAMIDTGSGRSGWDAWSQAQADEARARHAWRAERLRRDAIEADLRLAERAQARLAEMRAASADGAAISSQSAIVEAAIARAQRREPG